MSKILLLIMTTLIITSILFVCGLLCFTLSNIEGATGLSIKSSQLTIRLNNFNPVFNIKHIDNILKDGSRLQIKSVIVILNTWQSILHMHWQFSDILLYQVKMQINALINSNDQIYGLEKKYINHLLFKQLNRLELHDSEITFVSPFSQKIKIDIPKLNWLSIRKHYYIIGQINISSLEGQHGIVKIQADLNNKNSKNIKGKFWFQAKNIDIKPWVNSSWIKNHTILQKSHFNFESRLNIENGDIIKSQIFIKQKEGSYKEERKHSLLIDNLTVNIFRKDKELHFYIPPTRIRVDNKLWSSCNLTIAWVSKSNKISIFSNRKKDNNDKLRFIISHLKLSDLEMFRYVVTQISPKIGDILCATNPSGEIDELVLNVLPWSIEKTSFYLSWRDISWKEWKLIPGVEHLSGILKGDVTHGCLKTHIYNALIQYKTVFRIPLEIEKGTIKLNWLKNENGFQFDAYNFELKAKSVHINGNFYYMYIKKDKSWMNILAEISAEDKSQAWHYFPESLMGKALVNYFSRTIKHGYVSNAKLIYKGNPYLFPYKQKEGQFQILAHLHNVTFKFKPGWPALKNFDVELNFLNDKLWIKTNDIALGNFTATSLTAVIPIFSKKKIFIDIDIHASGKAIRNYFESIPLSNSLIIALDELQIDGDIDAHLHLDVPLDNKATIAKGDVSFIKNNLYIKCINNTLKNINGQFSFTNSTLKSQSLKAMWFNQPINLDFYANKINKDYKIVVNMNADWQLSKMKLLLKPIEEKINGIIPWKGKITIDFPYRANTKYNLDIKIDLKNIRSYLPSPINKNIGKSLPFKINLNGTSYGFKLSGGTDKNNNFSSYWLIKRNLATDKFVQIESISSFFSMLYLSNIELHLSQINGDQCLGILKKIASIRTVSQNLRLPENIVVHTPTLILGGQCWNNLIIKYQLISNGSKIEAKGQEINANLIMYKNSPWQTNIYYAYYNPIDNSSLFSLSKTINSLFNSIKYNNFNYWPNLQLHCSECWLWGQKYSRIDGNLIISNNKLKLDNILVEAEFGKFTAKGEWINKIDKNYTFINGYLKGEHINNITNLFDMTMPIYSSSFNINYNLNWHKPLWQIDKASLNGILEINFGKGEITQISTGHAGQLLRFLSFDALLRKLHFDFSDIFNKSFYFDSIRSIAWIKNGVVHTNDTLVDGLEADIKIKGYLDLLNSEIDLKVYFVPEIFTTIGLATALFVNPIIGTTVFAISKILGVLWNKISILSYHITGSIDHPQINKAL